MFYDLAANRKLSVSWEYEFFLNELASSDVRIVEQPAIQPGPRTLRFLFILKNRIRNSKETFYERRGCCLHFMAVDTHDDEWVNSFFQCFHRMLGYFENIGIINLI